MTTTRKPTLTPLDPTEATRLLTLYPFYSIAASRALLTPSLTPHQTTFFRRAIALNAHNIHTLTALTEPTSPFADFYPPLHTIQTPTTENAIDTFLSTYGTPQNPTEEAILEKLIFNPTPDYSEILARQTRTTPPPTTPHTEQDRLLDAFLHSQTTPPPTQNTPLPEPTTPPQPLPVPPPQITDPQAPLSESLAKIFIKRHRYDKAYEIIHQLSLEFPEKSIYFADQLRFLRKLIYIQKHSSDKKNN